MGKGNKRKLFDGCFRVREIKGGINSKISELSDYKRVVKEFTYSKDDGQKELRRKRFINEITILEFFKGNLNYAQIDNCKNIEEKPWFIMEELTPLTDLLENLKLKERLDLCLQLIIIIKDMHEKGIANRDIKPDNLLIRKKDGIMELVICDFGTAIYEDNELLGTYNLETDDAERIGSADYIPFELRSNSPKGEPANYYFKSDIYSYVKTVWAILKGSKYTFGTGSTMFLNLNKLDDVFSADYPGLCIEPLYQMIDKGINEYHPEERPTEDECIALLNLIVSQIVYKGSFRIGKKFKLDEICRKYKTANVNESIDDKNKIKDFILEINNLGNFTEINYFKNMKIQYDYSKQLFFVKLNGIIERYIFFDIDNLLVGINEICFYTKPVNSIIDNYGAEYINEYKKVIFNLDT